MSHQWFHLYCNLTITRIQFISMSFIFSVNGIDENEASECILLMDRSGSVNKGWKGKKTAAMSISPQGNMIRT